MFKVLLLKILVVQDLVFFSAVDSQMLKVQSSLSLGHKVIKSGRTHTVFTTSSNNSLLWLQSQSLLLQ